MQRLDLRRPACGGLLALLAGTAAACTPDREPMPAVTADPSPSGVALRTIANHKTGDRITLTAGLSRVLNDQAFVVRDVDLPDQGLLVLGRVPAGTRPPALITVSGVIAVLDSDLAGIPDDLDATADITPFRNRKIVIADTVRSWS
ncbi:hypothetical protein [Actinoplanes sp. NPDC026619]|uniref:hypothetical protein n=1 Tax=Actinoplanes sp. NPDC026619 TaxID=3155798 RepID=UPI00340BE458